MQHQWVSRAFGVRAPRLRERFVPSSEAYVRAALMGWGVGVAPGALVALRADVTLAVELFWHQWKLGPDGAPPSPRVGMLDRIGAALAAGANAALAPPGGRAAAGRLSGRGFPGPADGAPAPPTSPPAPPVPAGETSAAPLGRAAGATAPAGRIRRRRAATR
jgi:hypothetical protein